MKEKLELLALRDNVESAFKSMIKSGRPDILDEDNNNLLPQLYVDLIDGDYYLKQALDENHVILKAGGVLENQPYFCKQKIIYHKTNLLLQFI